MNRLRAIPRRMGTSARLWREVAIHRPGAAPGERIQNRPRQGAILVAAMIALLIVSMIGASLLRTSVASLRQLHREQQRMQTDWLADAGCQRAVFRLRSDPDYTGEDWSVPSHQLQSQLAGDVRITVSADPKSESIRIVTVVAEYPRNSSQKIRISRHIPAPRRNQDSK